MTSNRIFTHRSVFHADEVFAIAIVRLVKPNVKIHRVSVEDAEAMKGQYILIDTGREYDPKKELYDHHQEFLTRDDGFPYASAGLLWKQCGDSITQDQDVSNRVDELLIKGIDAADADGEFQHVGICSAGDVGIVTLSNIIGSFNTDDIQNDDLQMIGFMKAVDFATMIILNAVKSAEKYIEDLIEFDSLVTEEGNVITLPKYVKDWREMICGNFPNINFVIMPGGQSPFQLLSVPVKASSRELKQPIERPEWFGGFIHQTKWIAGCKSLEEAEKLAKDQ